MFKNNKGYIFEIKKNLRSMQQGVDASGQSFPLYGVKEEMVYSFCGNLETVNLVFGLDGAFDVMKPAYFDTVNGLTLLDRLIVNDIREDINNFSKSHRATYSVCPTLICNVVGKLDRYTHQWQEGTRCNFYIQRGQCVEVIKDKEKDCVCCDLYSAVKGLHTFCSNDSDVKKIEAVQQALANKVLLQIAPYLANKEDFWLARMGVKMG